jgi:hypothetical protein
MRMSRSADDDCPKGCARFNIASMRSRICRRISSNTTSPLACHEGFRSILWLAVCGKTNFKQLSSLGNEVEPVSRALELACFQNFSRPESRPSATTAPGRNREFGRVPRSRHSTQAKCPAKSTVTPLLFRIVRFDDAACDVCRTRRSTANRRGGQPSLSASCGHSGPAAMTPDDSPLQT